MLEQIKNDKNIKDELLNQIKMQNKLLSDMVPKIGNNNINNNNFNINLFLNEKCRDAINMSEFLESIKIKFEDLHYTQNNGMIEGISNVFVNGLKELDTFKRPIHCTDIKRETLYIKDNNEWDKQNCKGALKNAINSVADKQRKAIREWEIEHQDWDKSEKGKEDYINLIRTVMSDSSDLDSKIIKNIAKNTIIDYKEINNN